MTVGLLSLARNDLLAASDPTTGSITVGPEEMLILVVLGGIAGIWLFLKILAAARKLLAALAVGAILVLLHQHGLPDLFGPIGEAGATQTEIPPMGDFLPR